MKRLYKSIVVIFSLFMLFSICACQTDFSRPADYAFDTKNSEKTYTLDLSGMELPGTSKTFVFEVKNTSGSEKEYALTALLIGNLPLTCEITPESEDMETIDGSTAKGNIGKNEKHRYTLTVTWPAEENSYIYAGGVASVTVEGFAE